MNTLSAFKHLIFRIGSWPVTPVLMLIPFFLMRIFHRDLFSPPHDGTWLITLSMIISALIVFNALSLYILLFCIYKLADVISRRETYLYIACLVVYGLIVFAAPDMALRDEQAYFAAHQEAFVALQKTGETSACYVAEVGCLVKPAVLPEHLYTVFGERVVNGRSKDGFYIMVTHRRGSLMFVTLDTFVPNRIYTLNNQDVVCPHVLSDKWALCETYLDE